MMKAIISILMVLATVLCLSACVGETNTSNSGSLTQQISKTSEQQGVPKKQLEAEIYPSNTKRNYVVTSCTHNVDTTLHQDTIVIEYYTNYKYMRTDYVQSYTYQYNRATDIWTQISKGKRNYNYTLLENLRNSKWSGKSDAGFGKYVYYDISVDAINTINGWIKFSYDISFAGKDYHGTKYMEYGEFTLTQVEYMFRITFDPDDGFTVSRN